jgi:tetratricopeptide (TPR) repeat protein
MSAKQDGTSDAGAALAETERTVEARGAEWRSDGTPAASGRLIEALMELAGQHHARGDETSAAAALAEAEALIPSPPPSDGAWPVRIFTLRRAKAGFAQSRGRHAEAIEHFQTALSDIPFAPGEGGRDVNAARLHLFVRMARSRLALQQAAEVTEEVDQCEIAMQALDGEIPARALDTIRAAVLDNHAAALALLGEVEAAEAKFAAGVELIDRLGGPELSDLRQRMLGSWMEMLRAAGREAEANALLTGSSDQGDAHSESESGHDHHNHNHDHPHDAGRVNEGV